MLLSLKAPKHEYIFPKYFWNLSISEIFWVCSTKNNFPIIFSRCKKPHFLTSIEIWNFTFQIKPVGFETRNFSMGLKAIFWNWGISFVFKSKHHKYTNTQIYLNNFMLHVEILLKQCFRLNFKNILKKYIRVPGLKVLCEIFYLMTLVILR